MLKLFFILSGLIFLNTVNGQINIKPTGFAFNIIIQPGNIPVDENGVPVKLTINKERFIYIITKGSVKPVLKSITYNKVLVKWNIVRAAEQKYSATSKSTQKTIIIKPTKGSSMWRIDIQEFPNHSISDTTVPIIIKGSSYHKPFSIFVFKETPVQGYDSY